MSGIISLLVQDRLSIPNWLPAYNPSLCISRLSLCLCREEKTCMLNTFFFLFNESLADISGLNIDIYLLFFHISALTDIPPLINRFKVRHICFGSLCHAEITA